MIGITTSLSISTPCHYSLQVSITLKLLLEQALLGSEPITYLCMRQEDTEREMAKQRERGKANTYALVHSPKCPQRSRLGVG